MRQDDAEVSRELIRKILKLAKIDTFRQFIESIEGDDEDILRCSQNPAGTDTGRFSHGTTFLEPSRNLGNMPKNEAKRDEEFKVRPLLGPPDPTKAWLSVDFSSAERRLLAYLADESRAIEQIESDIDAYRWFYAKLAGIDDWRDIPKGSPQRAGGKEIVLAADRGIGWSKLKKTVNKKSDMTGFSLSASEAKEAVELFHNLYPGYKRFFDRVEQTLRDKGFLVNCMGRKRIFFGRRSRMDSLVREGVSFLAQAVGDILNARLIDIYEELDPEDLQILLQVHDQISVQCEPGKVNRLKTRLLEIMEKPINLTQSTPRPTTDEIVIPSDVSVSTTSWGAETEIT